ncbi:hypothetical protein [Nonomuraea sp. SYSU D8015]|nr:hypothetical protein [Nonomuraea sp. SYSU D8015]
MPDGSRPVGDDLLVPLVNAGEHLLDRGGEQPIQTDVDCRWGS